jgi:hypothetical protein
LRLARWVSWAAVEVQVGADGFEEKVGYGPG